MNKKLPEVYHNNENIVSNNKNTYISFKEKSEENNNIESIIGRKEESKENTYINFFNYFNKHLKITTVDNKVIETKILSKLDNKILLENGDYLEIEKIKYIN